MTIGEKIRMLRQQAGLSQSQLADALAVSRAAVAKWENENGMPDISNLKLLADYFHIDVDTLVDEARALPLPRTQLILHNTFCGRSCDECDLRETLQCSGCKTPLGTNYHDDCQIAKCCRKKNLLFCANCDGRSYCADIRRAENIAPARQKAIFAQQEHLERLKQIAALFGKNLWALFWISVVRYGIQVLFHQRLLGSFAVMANIGAWLSLLLTVGASVCLLRIARVNRRFMTAGWLELAAGILNLVVHYLGVLSGEMWPVLLVSIISIVLCLYQIYEEFGAYHDVLNDFDSVLAQNWEKLQMIIILSYIGSICGLLLATLFALLGSLITIVSSICSIVATFAAFILRHGTAETISRYQR